MAEFERQLCFFFPSGDNWEYTKEKSGLRCLKKLMYHWNVQNHSDHRLKDVANDTWQSHIYIYIYIKMNFSTMSKDLTKTNGFSRQNHVWGGFPSKHQSIFQEFILLLGMESYRNSSVLFGNSCPHLWSSKQTPSWTIIHRVLSDHWMFADFVWYGWWTISCTDSYSLNDAKCISMIL